MRALCSGKLGDCMELLVWVSIVEDVLTGGLLWTQTKMQVQDPLAQERDFHLLHQQDTRVGGRHQFHH